MLHIYFFIQFHFFFLGTNRNRCPASQHYIGADKFGKQILAEIQAMR